MFIKNFANFLNEADETPVATTTNVDVEKDLTERISDMEKVRSEVIQIQTAANQLKSLTKLEDIDKRMEELIKKYESQDDSLISSALSYYKMLAEQAKLVLRQKQFETQIPELATQLENDLNDLVQRIADLRKTA